MDVVAMRPRVPPETGFTLGYSPPTLRGENTDFVLSVLCSVFGFGVPGLRKGAMLTALREHGGESIAD
jgi:hypothetical protein